jgi:hypothetical protein
MFLGDMRLWQTRCHIYILPKREVWRQEYQTLGADTVPKWFFLETDIWSVKPYLCLCESTLLLLRRHSRHPMMHAVATLGQFHAATQYCREWFSQPACVCYECFVYKKCWKINYGGLALVESILEGFGHGGVQLTLLSVSVLGFDS